MFSFLEAIFSLLTALINACFPCSCGHAPTEEDPKPKKRRRYSVTETTTTTHTKTVETIGTSTSSPNLQNIEKQVK